MNHRKSFWMILLAAGFTSCNDFPTNAPGLEQFEAFTSHEKAVRAREVLTVKELVIDRIPKAGEMHFLLTGQVVYLPATISNLNGQFLDIDFIAELELRPLTGEEVGWKIGGASKEQVRVNRKSRGILSKHYFIDQADTTRMLNLSFDVDHMRLTLKRTWISGRRKLVNQ